VMMAKDCVLPHFKWTKQEMNHATMEKLMW
jgi:hypothetical protein